jgi:hypothetical protein
MVGSENLRFSGREKTSPGGWPFKEKEREEKEKGHWM